MKNLQVLSTDDCKEWSKLLESCEQADLHFRPEFMKLFEEKMNGKAMLLVSRDINNENYVLYPFFKRRINDLVQFSSISQEYFDFVSPWYYGGIILQSKKNQKKTIKNFLNDFQDFIKEQNIVSEFTRIHPILPASQEYAHLTNATYQYDVAYLNLNQSLQSLWNNIKKAHKSDIKSAIRNGIEIKFSTNESELKSFHEMYEKSMKRLEAEDFYFFSHDFMKSMKNSLKNNFVIGTAWYKEKPVGQAVFLFQYGIFYYWLAAYDFEYRNLHPNHLLVYESILQAKKNNNDFFYFGGGRNENLRKFKEAFGGMTTGCYTIRSIHNHKSYSHLNKLCKRMKNPTPGYFPEYRG